LLEGALQVVARQYREGQHRWISGGVRWIDGDGRDLGSTSAPGAWMTTKVFACLGWCCVWHMATYVSRGLFEELGGFKVDFKDAGDYEFFARALSQSSYKRITRPLAAYRLTGQNNSVIHRERTNLECRRVLNSFGPPSDLERIAYRYLLKLWVNGANPVWCAKKWTRKWKHRSITTECSLL
jgi:hypothetical protein